MASSHFEYVARLTIFIWLPRLVLASHATGNVAGSIKAPPSPLLDMNSSGASIPLRFELSRHDDATAVAFAKMRATHPEHRLIAEPSYDDVTRQRSVQCC